MLIRMLRNRLVVAALLFLSGVGTSWAEPLSTQDRDEIGRLRAMRGFAAEDVNQLIEQVNKAGERGFPTESLANKVKEGLAKGIEPQRIDPVLRQMVNHFETAQEVLRETGSRGAAEGNRFRAVEMMAEAFSRGATTEEVRELARFSENSRHRVTQETLAAGAKSLAVMKEGRIPSKDGTALVGEGLRQGYRPSELIDLSREVKRHGSEFQDGRASIHALREQVSRGERGDQLFREDRSGSGGGDRGDRGGHGDSSRDRLDRPDRSGHSDRPDRSEKLDRHDRSDRSGSGRDR